MSDTPAKVSEPTIPTEAPKQSMSEPTTSETKDQEQQQQESPSPTLTAAKQLISDMEWEKAVDVLTIILENLSKSDQASKPNIAEIYYQYGRALFRLSQEQNDVFGGAVREKQAQYAALQAIGDDGVIPEEDDDAEMAESSIKEQNTDEKTADETNAGDDNAADENNVPSDGPKNENDEKEADPNAALMDAFASIFEQAHAMKAEMDAAVAQGDVDTSEDRVLAWESLETARSLLSESADPEKKKLLGDTHFLLAELQMEDEEFGGAAEDFEKAVRIYSELNCAPRTIASVYVLWACSSQYNENNLLATEQFETAAELLLKEMAQVSGQDIDVGGPKSEFVSLLQQKDNILAGAKKFGEEQGGEMQKQMEEFMDLFQETFERVQEAASADAQKMSVDAIDVDENMGAAVNGVTTVGFEPVAPASGPINDLGVIKKRKRTAEDAGLEGPDAKKQRVD